MSTPLEIRLHAALKRIAAYTPPEKLERRAEKDYGLPYEEALAYAYENVIGEAKAAIEGVRIKPEEPRK